MGEAGNYPGYSADERRINACVDADPQLIGHHATLHSQRRRPYVREALVVSGGYKCAQLIVNKATVKRHLHNLGLERLRWKTKADNVRRSGQRVRKSSRYVLIDPEIDNFTYDIRNKDELAGWLDEVCGGGEFLWELENDAALRSELDRRTRRRPSVKTPMFFGRRLGW